MQRIHDRGNIGKLILDVEKSPTPLVSESSENLPSVLSQAKHYVQNIIIIMSAIGAAF